MTPARSSLADDVLAATAAAAAEQSWAPAPRAPARRLRPVALLAAALVVLAAWSGWVASLHRQAQREQEREVQLLAADRSLHELELMRWRVVTGDLELEAGRAAANTIWDEMLPAVEGAHADAERDRVNAMRAAVAALRRSLVGDRERVASGELSRREARFTPELARVDDLINEAQDHAAAEEKTTSARAWRLTGVSGAGALLVAGLLLLGFGRTRRTAARLRTEAARAEGERAALRDAGRRLRALVRHASDSVAVLDAAGAIVFVTESIDGLLGRPAPELRGRRFEELVEERDRRRLAELLAAARGTPDATGDELALRHADGHAVPVDLRVADRLADPDVAGVVLTVRDVSERRRLESELRRSALSDRQTGLANRACFEQWLRDALGRGPGVAAVLIDLDDFKTVNDSLGHSAGDRCLVACADRLREAVGNRGRLARLGGDEFGVLIEAVAGPEAAESAARRLLDAVGGAVRLDGADVPLTGSAGVALAAPGDMAEDLLRCADTAVHAAKARGASHVQVYSPAMHEHAIRRLALRAALSRAVERGELELAYQPVVDLDRDETTGVEALLRWRTPDGDPVSPADFIPIAEASGLIVPIGAWVLERACTDVAPLDELTVAVNVSAVQLRIPDFALQVADALERSGLPPRRLVLELTESAVMDDVPGVQEAFQALRALGVQLAIDDFGTGFSSLSTLAALPVDLLKLDRSFVAAMAQSATREALVGGVVSLASRLGLPLVAEGVEDGGQLDALRALGCRFAQGYHLGRPGPLADACAVDAGARGLR
jgi:diguanylate cyclase (GGDEF)-like protein/PAS domain S-box-containing protein